METNKKKLGEMLLETGLIDELQLSSALGQQKQWGGRLASILINKGFIEEKSIASILEKKLNQKYMPLENKSIPADILKIVKLDVAKKYSIFPLALDKKTLTLAMSDPTDLSTIDELSFALGLQIKPVLAIESSINQAIKRHYSGDTTSGKQYVVNLKNLPQDMQLTRNEPPEPVKQSHSAEMQVETLAEMLIEKGLIKEQELASRLAKKLKQSPWKTH